MRWFFATAVFLTIVLSAQAQSKKIATVAIQQPTNAYVDRPGDLYVSISPTRILKFDTLGKAAGELTFEHPVTVFDPRDGARMFSYLTDTKKASFFSSETKKEIVIEEHYAIEPVLVSSAGDHQLWIVDKSDWSVKRIDPRNATVITEVLIDQTQFARAPNFIAIREYQSFLFLIEKNTGILIFNNLGKQVKKIALADIEYLNFLGEELYYKKGGTLFFYDLFDGATRELKVDASALYILLTDTRTYTVYKDRVEVFPN
jgi:hypothetical protein